MSEKNLDYYIRKFTQLRIDRSHGRPAPHKPILLLSIIELIERGVISTNEIELTPEIVSTFLSYWNALYPDQKGIVALPFFHLKSDGFWHIVPNDGYEKSFNLIRHIKSSYQIRDMVRHAYLDKELFALLLLDKNRTMFRRVIINDYFDPEEKNRLVKAINLSRKAMKYEHLLIAEANEPYTANIPQERIRFKEKVREAGFRHLIMSIYNYTCSVCNMRILTLEGASVVDAAHIVPFSVSANDDIRNGIALCKLHHWSFDEGLISIDDSFRVMITPLLNAQRPTEWLLTGLKNKQIMLPQNETLYPAQEALHYHRENKFIK
ncbi:MAG: HNH endonuclease [Nitrospirae bacterium]|nr:HNH endonuclease [Nitrospirota bacterium]